LLGRGGDTLSLYDGSLSEWAASEHLPMNEEEHEDERSSKEGEM